MKTSLRPTCPYCQSPAKLAMGSQIYPHRPDLRRLAFWACTPCDARVGCHKGSLRPFGRLADAELRLAKSEAHAAFDPLWQSHRMSRKAAYGWLAEQLGLSVERTHIGEFDLATCALVVELCNQENLSSNQRR